MKKGLFVSILSYILLNSAFSQTDTTYLLLKGFEDENGNSFLLYSTMHSKYDSLIGHGNSVVDSTILKYHVYDISNNKTTLITEGFENIYYPENHLQYKIVSDVEFLNNDPTKYIYSVNSLGIDPDGQIYRYDSQNSISGILGHFDDIFISSLNSNHVYAIADNWITHSMDSGDNWDSFNIIPFEEYSFIKLIFSPFDESILFGITSSDSYYSLLRSEDSSKTFDNVCYLSDIFSEIYSWNPSFQFLFDKDKKHIYLAINNNNFSSYRDNSGVLFSSNNFGNYDSWELKGIYYKPINIAVDDSASGKLYLSSGNTIFTSDNYGEGFSQLIDLPHNANGMYKDPKNNILYASTNNGIIQINNDSSNYLIKSSITRSLQFYPIAVGNKWTYKTTGVRYEVEPIPIDYTSEEIITKDSVDNGIHYFYLVREPSNFNSWIKVDSSQGYIYSLNDLNKDKGLITISLAATGRDLQTLGQGMTLYHVSLGDTLLWGKRRYTKTFYLEAVSDTTRMTYVQGIGLLESKGSFDFGHFHKQLVECTIDGKLYKNTIVDIEESNGRNSITLNLYQNYPNPFNPVTTIKYTIPLEVKSQKSKVKNVTLKVFDVLGREIATLVDQKQKPGNYSVHFDAASLSSGIYYYQLITDSFVLTKKMILLK